MKLVVPPVPRLHLSPWAETSTEAWNRHTDRATELTRGPGVGRNFEALVRDARALLLAGDTTAVAARFDERRFLRALVTVWLEDARLARHTLTLELVERLQQHLPSRLTTLTWASLLLTHFDGLDDWRPGLFGAVRDLLQQAVAAHPARGDGDALEVLRRNDQFLMARGGPRRLAAALVASGSDLDGWLRDELLSGYADTRFARTARDEFYLAQIDAADAERGDHPFLEAITNEVLARQRTENTDRDGRYFGHRVLDALTSKATRRPSEQWLTAVLTIGGDPRLTQTQQWRTWWSKVLEPNRVRAVRWMSGVNLTAFLDGVEAYAKHTSNTSMQRMLERRKNLLIGLYEQDRVEDVRLVLGSDISRWITKSTRVDLSDAARLLDSGKDDTAVVYVDCGDFCIVEGSHNFKLHVYIGGPLARLADRSQRVFPGAQLRDELPRRHELDHGVRSYFSTSHYSGGSWITTALDFIRHHGITLDERSLMTGIDYADLARRRAGGW